MGPIRAVRSSTPSTRAATTRSSACSTARCRAAPTCAGTRCSGGTTSSASCAERVEADGYVVAIGDNFARGAVLDRADADCADLTLITVAHPTAVIARDAVVGAGSILLAGSVVSNGCVVGRGVLLGTHASIDHDGHVDDHASLGPGATTGGNVSIGATTAVGLGASVIHGITIGADTVVGAGALVLADLPRACRRLRAARQVVRPRAARGALPLTRWGAGRLRARTEAGSVPERTGGRARRVRDLSGTLDWCAATAGGCVGQTGGTLSDRAPRPGEGNGQQYQLPDQYGPARAPVARRATPADRWWSSPPAPPRSSSPKSPRSPRSHGPRSSPRRGPRASAHPGSGAASRS